MTSRHSTPKGCDDLTSHLNTFSCNSHKILHRLQNFHNHHSIPSASITLTITSFTTYTRPPCSTISPHSPSPPNPTLPSPSKASELHPNLLNILYHHSFSSTDSLKPITYGTASPPTSPPSTTSSYPISEVTVSHPNRPSSPPTPNPPWQKT